jgi:hypothetical protein
MFHIILLGVFGFKNPVIEKVKNDFFQISIFAYFFQIVHFSFFSSLFSLSGQSRVSFSN